MSQGKRNLVFVQFNRNDIRALVATNVGSRGLDFPDVDWSVSIGPPHHLKDYIHRAGRSARNERFGRSLLLLAPNEAVFAARVRDAKIDIKRIELRIEGVDGIRERLNMAVREGHRFVQLAKDAVAAFENGYRSRPPAEGISIDDVDMAEVRLSFGLGPDDYEE
jgi:superfamily II DNA/RNA helicase